LEDSGSRMGRIGGSMLVRGEITSIADHLERIRAVTIDEVAAVMKRVFLAPRTVAAVGPFSADEPALTAAVNRIRA